jgi:hypothetical protein
MPTARRQAGAPPLRPRAVLRAGTSRALTDTLDVGLTLVPAASACSARVAWMLSGIAPALP